MSIITKMIVKADAETRYPSLGEMEQIKIFIMNGERRLRIVQALTGSRQRIVQQTGEQLFQKQPRLISPGGNAYGQDMTATCLRDLDYYLRLITYSIASGENSPIQDIGLNGVHEMYRSLGTPIESVAEGVRVMKGVATSLLSAEDASEVGGYFDFLVGALDK